MTDNMDMWIKIGGGFFLGVVTLMMFGSYVWPLIAACLGVAGLGAAAFLIWDGLMDMEMNDG